MAIYLNKSQFATIGKIGQKIGDGISDDEAESLSTQIIKDKPIVLQFLEPGVKENEQDYKVIANAIIKCTLHNTGLGLESPFGFIPKAWLGEGKDGLRAIVACACFGVSIVPAGNAGPLFDHSDLRGSRLGNSLWAFLYAEVKAEKMKKDTEAGGWGLTQQSSELPDQISRVTGYIQKVSSRHHAHMKIDAKYAWRIRLGCKDVVKAMVATDEQINEKLGRVIETYSSWIPCILATRGISIADKDEINASIITNHLWDEGYSPTDEEAPTVLARLDKRNGGPNQWLTIAASLVLKMVGPQVGSFTCRTNVQEHVGAMVAHSDTPGVLFVISRALATSEDLFTIGQKHGKLVLTEGRSIGGCVFGPGKKKQTYEYKFTEVTDLNEVGESEGTMTLLGHLKIANRVSELRAKEITRAKAQAYESKDAKKAAIAALEKEQSRGGTQNFTGLKVFKLEVNVK